MVGTLVVADERDDPTAPAAFEAIDAGHCLVGLIGGGNAPEIVCTCPGLSGPAHRLPLQELVGHQVAPRVAGGSVQIDRLASQQADKNAGQQLTLRTGHKELSLPAWSQNLPDLAIVIEGVNAKVVALASGLEESVPGSQFVERAGDAHLDPLTRGQAHV